MTDDLTPWEDINPPMASARRHEPQSQSSDDETRTVFRNELTACLTLVAPVGMTEEARRDWFAVAWDSLKHLPADLLTYGARKARQQCDHPSKIVPTIIAETAESLRWRRERSVDQQPEQPRLEKPDYCTPAEAARILQEMGIKPSFAP